MRQSDSYARQVEAARLPLAHLDAAARACSSTAAGSAGRAGINLASYWNPGPAPERGQLIPLGKAKIVKPGKDVTLIGYSRSMLDIPVVASKLSAEGGRLQGHRSENGEPAGHGHPSDFGEEDRPRGHRARGGQIDRRWSGGISPHLRIAVPRVESSRTASREPGRAAEEHDFVIFERCRQFSNRHLPHAAAIPLGGRATTPSLGIIIGPAYEGTAN
jgi:hypothetical protein